MTRWQRAGAAAALALLVGCATPPLVDPGLFPRATSQSMPIAGLRIALVVAPAVAQTVARDMRLFGAVARADMPVGQIVERAGAELLSVQPQPQPPADTASVIVDAVDCTLREHIKWMLPVPYMGVIGDSSTDVRVTMSLRVVDAAGRVQLARGYDSGPKVLPSHFGGSEPAPLAIRRLVHEAAWQLWQQAADDIRHWQSEERMRERPL
jgi:hypothetical protein